MPEPGARIALFLKGKDFGGVQRVFAILAKAFVERGHEVDLVLAGPASPLFDELPTGVRRVQLEPGSRWQTLRALRNLPVTPPGMALRALRGRPRLLLCLPSLAGYLRERRPAGLLASMPFNNLLAVWATQLAGVGTRCVVREAQTFSPKQAHSPRPTWRLPEQIPLFYPEASAIVSVSDGVADDLAEATGLARERITTIYNPVDLERIGVLAAQTPDHPWLAAGEPPVILGAGRLHPQKDFATLLRAFAQVRSQQRARLVILGEGTEREALESLARELGVADDVSLVGFVANPFAYMARSAVFALSSAWEGLANVLIEALACGTPVVSTDCPNGPAEILEGGAHGPLVKVGDHEALAEQIAALLRGPREREPLLRRARDFSHEHAVDRYLGALLGRHVPAATQRETAGEEAPS